jgi:hypothetical protein
MIRKIIMGEPLIQEEMPIWFMVNHSKFPVKWLIAIGFMWYSGIPKALLQKAM